MTKDTLFNLQGRTTHIYILLFSTRVMGLLPLMKISFPNKDEIKYMCPPTPVSYEWLQSEKGGKYLCLT